MLCSLSPTYLAWEVYATGDLHIPLPPFILISAVFAVVVELNILDHMFLQA